jgi:drug/metabolite transporter (DMT)-like permease
MTMAPPLIKRSPQLGIIFMICCAGTFGLQDGLSRLLAESYNPITVVGIRYWFFALFVLAFSQTRPGGIQRVAETRHPVLQVIRGLLLISQITTAVWGFTLVGLVGWQVIFSSYPLMVAAMSMPFLGERVGWRRWLAIAAGFCGVVIALDPQAGMFHWNTLIVIFGSVQFAAYSILTRYVGRDDSAMTSFFWTGIVGAIAISLVMPFFWSPPIGSDWGLMGLLCITGVSGHFFMIKALEQAEASLLQPFAYLGMVTSAAIGYFAFGDIITPVMFGGAVIIVGAGLFTFWRERKSIS